MKFIVDAQLPRKLSGMLVSRGFDSIHTLDLPAKNLTPDNEIIEICEKQNRIIITKDSDFYDSKIIRNKPKKLIVIQTGNIRNEILFTLFETHFDKIIQLIEQFDVVEMNLDSIITK